MLTNDRKYFYICITQTVYNDQHEEIDAHYIYYIRI